MEDSATVLCDCLIGHDENPDKAGYEIVRNSILKNLLAFGAITSRQLGVLVESHLKHKSCDMLWPYFEAVCEDLEARGEIRYFWSSGLHLLEITA